MKSACPVTKVVKIMKSNKACMKMCWAKTDRPLLITKPKCLSVQTGIERIVWKVEVYSFTNFQGDFHVLLRCGLFKGQISNLLWRELRCESLWCFFYSSGMTPTGSPQTRPSEYSRNYSVSSLSRLVPGKTTICELCDLSDREGREFTCLARFTCTTAAPVWRSESKCKTAAWRSDFFCPFLKWLLGISCSVSSSLSRA